VQAYAFDNGGYTLAVIWADRPTVAKVKVGTRSAFVTDLVGRERQVQVDGDTLELPVGPAAQYVAAFGDVPPQLTGAVRPPGELPKLDPGKVVLVGYIDAGTLDKDRNCHVIRGDEPAPFVVDVYNFDEAKPARGRISLKLPEGWTGDHTGGELALEPMGRKSLRFQLQPGATGLAKGAIKIRVEGDFPGPKTAPSVSYVRLDLTTAKPKDVLDLNLDRTDAWELNIPPYGKMKIEPGPDGGVAFPITFTGPGDRWCYPRARFAEAQDWRQYQALAFEYRFDTDDDTTSARVQVIETGGSSYICPVLPAKKDWQRAVALFADMDYGSWSPKDADGKLDLDQIGSILIGCNTQKLDKLTLEVRNVELLVFE
jgi:hypothetical protein